MEENEENYRRQRRESCALKIKDLVLVAIVADLRNKKFEKNSKGRILVRVVVVVTVFEVV